MDVSGLDQPAEYVVKVHGSVDEDLADWLGPGHITRAAVGSERVSVLSGIHTDQAGIVGLIRHLHSLGIVLLSVERVAARQYGPLKWTECGTTRCQ